ncbi:MAG: hypothetical protein ACYDA8_07850 [Deferrisomatales bacterium]
MADPCDYTLRGPDDFVRLDQLCAELLQGFRDWLQTPAGGAAEPRHAGALAHAADRYLRDFVVDIAETGPADADPGLGRQYLGNWYIVHTLVPTHEQVDLILEALRRLYPYLEQVGVLTPGAARAGAEALADGGFFHDRLEAFWGLTPDDIAAWRAVADYRRRRAPA